jgi:DNA-binding CsgD family transcriptional regulator
MGYFRLADLDVLRSGLRELAAVRDLEAFPATALAVGARLVAADSITYNEIDLRRHRIRWQAIAHDELDSEAQDYFAHHADEHPVIRHQRATGDGAAYKISDFLSRAEYHRLSLYQTVYRPLRVEDQLAFTLPTDPSLVVGLAYNRDRRSFTERDRLILNLAREHFVQAYQSAELIDRLSTALDLANLGVIVLNERNRATFVSRRVNQWLSQFLGAGVTASGELPELLAGWVRSQAATLEASDDAPAPTRPLVVERDGERLVVRCVGRNELARDTQLLFALQPIRPTDQRLTTLGLTSRECQVLRFVAQGQSDVGVARALDLSPGTVKKHLERIYRKLGVSSRTAAIAHAFQGPALD